MTSPIMPVSEWVEVDPNEVIPEAEPLPPCGVGIEGHEWTLTIEYGEVSVSSGCPTCDEAVEWDYVCASMKGRITSEQDHPGLGGWHGDVRCDCNWWWEFRPSDTDETERPS